MKNDPYVIFRISYQSLAGSLSSLQKSEFLKSIVSFIIFGSEIEISDKKSVEKHLPYCLI